MQAFSLYTFILPILLCLIKGEVIPSVAPELLTAWCGAFVFTVLVPPVSSAKSREGGGKARTVARAKCQNIRTLMIFVSLTGGLEKATPCLRRESASLSEFERSPELT